MGDVTHEWCPICHRTVRVLSATRLFKHKAVLTTKTRRGRTCTNTIRNVDLLSAATPTKEIA